MRRINSINRNQVAEVRQLTANYYGYVDEEVEQDILFIIETAMGFNDNYKPDDWMLDIIDRVFPASYHFMDNHKKIECITKEQFSAIKSGVLKHHMCVDEYMIADILFIVEYVLGFKNSYIPDDYMIEIIENVFK